MINNLTEISKSFYGTATVLQCICDAAIKIQDAIRQPWRLGNIQGAGSVNIHGETVQPLDLFANNQFIHFLQQPGGCAGIASEELDDFVAFENENSQRSPYICLFDPLDGSSNINVHISIGSIFAIYRRVSPIGTPPTTADFLQAGHRQVAAGYVLYGIATVLVYATGAGADCFILDPENGRFRLTKTGIRVPLQGNTYAVNGCYFMQYSQQLQEYLKHVQHKAVTTGKCCTQRYTGSMVPDIHRCLLQGGLFMYPSTTRKPSGKLRLLYECNPMAFIIEAAGGKATDARHRILDIEPTSLHQRTPFFAGSKEMVNELLAYSGIT